jgi:hypothetical protein
MMSISTLCVYINVQKTGYLEVVICHRERELTNHKAKGRETEGQVTLHPSFLSALLWAIK